MNFPSRSIWASMISSSRPRRSPHWRRDKVEVGVEPLIGHRVEDDLQGVEPCLELVVRADHGPGGMRVWVRRSISCFWCVKSSSGPGLDVDFGKLPLAERIGFSTIETSRLFVPGNAEVELDQDGPLAHQILLEADHPVHEVLVLLGVQNPKMGSTTARLYQLRSNRTTSPREETAPHSAGRTIGRLLLRGPAQGDDTVVLFVHVTGDAADGPTLAGRVPPLEQDDHPVTVTSKCFCSRISSAW